MTAVLAIDQGTTSTRALAVEPDGKTSLVFSQTTRQIYPHPGWVEHDPHELLASVRAAVEAAPDGVRAVGLANQGESCLAWDRETGEPLSRVIVWQDQRTEAHTNALRADGAEELTLARAGLPLDPYFSASKLAWLYRNTPDAAALAAAGRLCLGTTDGFFRQHLTGRTETDIATASRTSLMSLDTGEWDAELCALFGVPETSLPTITPTHGALGAISRERVLAASIVDQQAALRGHGCSAPGEAKITFGTGAFALAVSGTTRPAVGPGALPTVAWGASDGALTYALEGGVYAAGAAVNWVRELGLFGEFTELNEGDTTPAIARGVTFVPALTGLACPHWDRRAKGAWFGLSLDVDRGVLARAVLEGVALRTAEVMAAIDREAPPSGAISIDGGMSQNAYFCQFLADCLGRPITISSNPERTALGLAALSAEAIGQPFRLPEAGPPLIAEPQPPHWADRFAAAVAAVQNYAEVAEVFPNNGSL
ncbi:MAG: FGGY family carbohydrate kinase [Pseudomonadota bacterium]